LEQISNALLQRLMAFAVIFYVLVYALESPIRYQLNLLGLDNLIFIRDLLLLAVLGCVFLYQLFKTRIDPAYYFFVFVIALHGTIFMLNIGSFPALALATKMLMTMLFGYIASDVLFKPSPRMLRIYGLIWLVTFIGLLIHKYDIVTFPWSGMTTKIGGVEVFVNRDWTLATGFIKRAAGFTRSSINAANLLPPLAFILLFNLRSVLVRLAVFALTFIALYWTTQKGSMLSFLIVGGLLIFGVKRFISLGRLWLVAATLITITMPLMLPGYVMPKASGQFSMSSFYERVEWMWPQTWSWLDFNNAFPFGVGLAGIGAAQNLYESFLLPDSNAADNLFVFMYLSFGVMSFVYLGWMLRQAFSLRRDAPAPAAHALAVLAFLIGYGLFISMFEDMMAGLFGGAALAALYHSARASRAQQQAEPLVLATPPMIKKMPHE